MSKTIEIDGKKYTLRPWTVRDWRSLQAACKDKDLVEQWITVAQHTVINDVGELYLADKKEHIEDTFPLTTLQAIHDGALDYNLPFFQSKPVTSSETTPK